MKDKIDAYVVKNINIVQCSVCNSSGFVEKQELINYHNHDYDYWNELCPKCNGEGRILKTEYFLEATYQLKHAYNNIRTFITKEEEPLAGRTTKDIYKIGRNNG